MMAMTRDVTIVLGLALLAGTASAHHSFAMFDSEKETLVEGTVREFQWTNPHSWIQLVVMEEGKAVEYSIEADSPNILSRRGWSKASFAPGDRVKITIHPMKDGSKGGSYVTAILANGKSL
jgi:hypothetical protein